MKTIPMEPEPFIRAVTCCADCPCNYVDMQAGDHQPRCNLLDEDLYFDVTEQVGERCPLHDRHVVIMKVRKAVPLPGMTCAGAGAGAAARPTAGTRAPGTGRSGSAGRGRGGWWMPAPRAGTWQS